MAVRHKELIDHLRLLKHVEQLAETVAELQRLWAKDAMQRARAERRAKSGVPARLQIGLLCLCGHAFRYLDGPGSHGRPRMLCQNKACPNVGAVLEEPQFLLFAEGTSDSSESEAQTPSR